MKERTVYMCNPKKNTECSKTNCAYGGHGGPCLRTLNREYAVVDAEGNPVVAAPEDRDAPEEAWKEWGKSIPSQSLVKPDEKGGCNGDYCEL